MEKSHAIALVAYNTWANRRVFAKASRLPIETLKRRAALSYPSPLETLVHIMDSQWTWRLALMEGLSWNEPRLTSRDFPSITALRRRWDEEDRLLIGWVKGLGEGELNGKIKYWWPRAKPRSRPLWALLTHIVNHSTQHRSELAAWLTSRRLSPGNIDFMHYYATIHH